MIRRWVMCADGTWNEPEQTDQGMPSPSNVVKLAAAVLPADARGIPQVVCYHPGVGENGGLLDHLNGGAFGVGLSRNIQDLYLFLALNYRPDDELFLFGFSRGAYTARSLAGLIRNVGILRPEYVDLYQTAYALYRDRTPETQPNAPRSMTFRRDYSWPDFSIRFIGVWDTVGALGIPGLLQIGKHLWEFHDTDLSSHVDCACQALAIDERRRAFQPCLWNRQPGSPPTQVLEQAWFPGVHCNVGGGYEDSGLSDGALDWMWDKAGDCGLGLDHSRRPTPNAAGVLRNSLTGGFILLGSRIRALGAQLPGSQECLHRSALERQVRVPAYAPANLTDFLKNNPRLVG